MTYERMAEFLRRRLIYAKIAGVLVWIVWLVGLGYDGDFQQDFVPQLIGADHLAFYSPARMILDGQGDAIYDHQALAKYQADIFHQGIWHDLEAFRNPPFYALLYTPTARLPYMTSFLIWTAVSFLCLAAGIWLMQVERLRIFSPRPWGRGAGGEGDSSSPRPWGRRAGGEGGALAWFGWSLTFVPTFNVIAYGQNSLLSFLTLCVVYRLLMKEKIFLAGFVSGLLWFKPTLLIGLIVWCLFDIRKLWPAALGATVMGLTLTAVTYPIIPESWAGFVESLQGNATFGGFDEWKMHNARAFWNLLLPGLDPLPMILTMASFGVALVWFAVIRRRHRHNIPIMFSASIGLMLWASPHTMIYEWTLILVAAMILWHEFPQQRTQWFVLFALAWVALFVSTELGRAQDWLWHDYLGYADPVIVQVSVPMLAYLGWKVLEPLRRSTMSRDAELKL